MAKCAVEPKITTPRSPETAHAIAVRSSDEERLARKAALDRLWGIGWGSDLDAMRLGEADHAAK